jgi:two-component system sensor histidine kinase UhpB
MGFSVLELNMYGRNERERFASMLKEQGSIHNVEFNIKNKAGKEFSILSSAELIEINGEIHTITILHDITERKLAEEALRESEEHFRTLFEQAAVGVALLETKTGRYVRINQKYCEFLGYSSEEMLQKELQDVTFPDNIQTNLDNNALLITGAIREFSIEKRYIRKDGTVVWGKLSASPLWKSGAKTETYFHIAVVEDITERKQAEEQLRHAKEQVERFNQHLTEAIENERARISREIHDELGQSLTALKIDMNWMQGHVIPKGEIETKLERMIDIVNSTIRNVQQIAADLRPDILEDLGLVPALEWYCEEFEKRTGIRCETNLEEIRSSNAQINLALFRVTQEALTNVARYSHATMVEVKLRQTGYILILEIIDNGIGLDKEIIDSNKSLGILGMRERIRQFNGSIDISSYKPQGTEVSVQIRMERE